MWKVLKETPEINGASSEATLHITNIVKKWIFTIIRFGESRRKRKRKWDALERNVILILLIILGVIHPNNEIPFFLFLSLRLKKSLGCVVIRLNGVYEINPPQAPLAPYNVPIHTYSHIWLYGINKTFARQMYDDAVFHGYRRKKPPRGERGREDEKTWHWSDVWYFSGFVSDSFEMLRVVSCICCIYWKRKSKRGKITRESEEILSFSEYFCGDNIFEWLFLYSNEHIRDMYSPFSHFFLSVLCRNILFHRPFECVEIHIVWITWLPQRYFHFTALLHFLFHIHHLRYQCDTNNSVLWTF